MDERKRMQRRIVLAGLGALSGLLVGLGAAIILTQGGHVRIDLEIGFPFVAIIIGAVVGFLDLPKSGNRILAAGIALVTLALGGFSLIPPASAQVGCDVAVSIDGTTTSLFDTSAEDPLVIDLSSTNEISFEATAEDVEQGTVEVSVLSVSPLGFLIEPGGTVLYFAGIDSTGTVRSTLQINKSGPTGFVITGQGYKSPILPLGRVELGIIVQDTSSGPPVKLCDEPAWIRFVAQPASNTTGWIAMGLTALGLAGFTGLLLAKEAGRPPPTVEPGPEPRPPFFKEPTQEPWIPSDGRPRPSYVESRVLDAQSQRIDTNAALVQGREYRLELTLNLGEKEKEREGHRDVTVSGRSAGIDVEPSFQFGFVGTPLSIEIPIIPKSKGRHDVAMDITSNGHLLQTERITVSVADNEGPQAAGSGQTTRTVFSASDFSAADLGQRKPRSLLVILESDEDGTVDARVLDQDGKALVTFDSHLQPAALAEAAADAREQLQRQLQQGPGLDRHVSRDQLETMLVPLVKAGKQMHRVLFPKGSVSERDVERVEGHVTEGAIIQVIQQRAGLGYSALPWALVYDHPFLPHTKRNRLCPDFPGHPTDACPNRDDPEVMCPTGFWGFRAIIEEPWVATDTAVLSPPVGGRGSVAIGYLDSELSDSERQASVLTQLGMEQMEDFDQLLDILRAQSQQIGLMYFYAHHARDHDIGNQGIRIGDELLSGLTFDVLNVEWKSRPLVIINGCASGDYSTTDPLSLLGEFRRAGAVGTVTTECTVWDPLAGALGEHIVNALAEGAEIGRTLLDLRRHLLVRDNNMLGFVYRLQALSETTATLQARPAETIEIDLRDREPSRLEDSAS